MKPARRTAFFAALAKANPEPKSDLVYASDFELLVAVVLSAQATDRSVNAATKGLYAQANTPAAMLALGEAGLVEHIRKIGLFRTKARNILALCRQLLDHHQGQVPRTRAALEALPGVGRKTANVVLNIAFGEASIAVDTHVFRVANRTGLAPGKDVRAVEDGLLAAVPAPYLQHAHHWLILHGRYCCKARAPECWHCPVARECEYADKTPAPESRPRPTPATQPPRARAAGAGTAGPKPAKAGRTAKTANAAKTARPPKPATPARTAKAAKTAKRAPAAKAGKPAKATSRAAGKGAGRV